MSEELAVLLLVPMNSSRKLSPSPRPLGIRLQVVGTGDGSYSTVTKSSANAELRLPASSVTVSGGRLIPTRSSMGDSAAVTRAVQTGSASVPVSEPATSVPPATPMSSSVKPVTGSRKVKVTLKVLFCATGSGAVIVTVGGLVSTRTVSTSDGSLPLVCSSVRTASARICTVRSPS